MVKIRKFIHPKPSRYATLLIRRRVVVVTSTPSDFFTFRLPGMCLDMYTLGFQTPLKQWVLIYNHHCLPKGFNHRNWVNHYFNGGGSPGYTLIFLLCVKLVPKFIRETLPKGRHFRYLEDPGIHINKGTLNNMFVHGCLVKHPFSMEWFRVIPQPG